MGIVFIVIFSVLLIFAPHFFAAIFTEGEAITTVPVFNLEQWGIVLPVFVISLLIGLDVYKRQEYAQVCVRAFRQGND